MVDMRGLQAYFLLLAAYKVAYSMVLEARRRLIDDPTWKPEIVTRRYAEASADPEVVQLEGEANRLWGQVRERAHLAIFANIEAFGLNDRIVTAVVYAERAELGRYTATLSELCALGVRGVAERLEIGKGKPLALTMPIYENETKIGFVDGDGVFRHETGSVLEALGYALASDGGRERLLLVDLNGAEQRVLQVIRACGTDREVFLGLYAEALKGIFVYGHGTRYDNGYCGAVNIVWRAATRELGQPHDGYSVVS